MSNNYLAVPARFGAWLLTFLTPLFLFVFSITVHAIDFESGDFYGSFDTTVSYGSSSRTSGVDRSIVGVGNAGGALGGPVGGFPGLIPGGITGNAASSNFDDGNTNFQDGAFSNLAKFTSELDLIYKNRFGTFVRFSGFNDFKLDEPDRDEKLTDAANRLAKRNLRLLDAYAWARFDLGNMPGEIRLGEQVISWGESTFIQNSINVINPFDVSKLRVPGSELKEALVPVGIVSMNLGVTPNISLEAFYQYDYEDTELEPVGTFFSTRDFIGDGGVKVQLGSGILSDRGSVNLITGAFDPDFAAVLRAPDLRPDEGGQYGAAVRIFAPALNDTEFGLFYLNFHSRTPVLSATTGSLAGVIAGGGAIAAAGAPCVGAFGAVAPAFIPTCVVLHGVNAYGKTANYFAEFREDIDLFGASFNTEIGQTGIALQGEYSFRNDVPLQVDDAEIFAAALQPLLGAAAAPSQLGTFGIDEIVPGFIERDVSQVQMTATKIFGPINWLKSDQTALIAEFAVTHVHNMPGKNTLRLEAPGTFTGGNPALTASGLQPFTESASNFADATSWGYQIRGRTDYLNAFGPVNLSPRFAWRHDVSGIAPSGLSGFREQSKAITLGMSASYLNEWVADFSYTNFFGAGRHNLLNDRDFFAVSFSYSF